MANMNSLPLISHHLFVAAVGSESRVSDRQARRDRPPAGLATPASEMMLEMLDARKRTPEAANRALQARITEAPA